ncbi:Putative antitoxin VapB45 [Anaerolineae bacterium]|nr:Putative antitoxin VapB45 [Anaerolineae bacterium]
MDSVSKGFLESLDAPAYSIAETTRLIGVPRSSVNYYLRGYQYTKEQMRDRKLPSIINQSDAGSTYASFLDLMDLLYVKEFLARGFHLQFLRKALAEAKKYLGTPHFARNEFYTSRDRIALKIPRNGILIQLMTGGQITISEITEKLGKKLDFADAAHFGLAHRFYPNGKDGAVVIDPQISFGRPTLIGYRVATATIYDLYQGENKEIKPVSDWFDIPVPKIQAAVQFEHGLWA